MPRSAPPDWVLDRRWQIGAQIREARIQAGLTQDAVAHAIPMDRASYIRIEQGLVFPKLDTLLLIANVIGVPLAELVR
ncbi:helix-turn-helix domain-containing protein [Streptomyces sp. S1]|uniref:helix-turn-helix domain-containing protein n=1 Tax=Streptomyces sp. S1 TaxID=718288 RepID=UPI003D74C667